MRSRVIYAIGMALVSVLATSTLTACSDPAPDTQEEQEEQGGGYSASDSYEGTQDQALKQIQESKG